MKTEFVAQLLTVFVLAFFLLSNCSVACFTAEQNSTLRNITSATNTSFSVMYNLLSMLCNRTLIVVNNTNYTNLTVVNVTEANFTAYYNKTETESLIPTDYINKSQLAVVVMRNELEDMEDSLQGNLSELKNEIEEEMLSDSIIDGWNESLWRDIESSNDELVDIVDEKISGIGDKYVTKDDFKNESNTLRRAIYTKKSAMDIYAPYIFWIAAIGIVGAVVVYKFAPQKFKGKLLKGFKAETHTIEELTTDSKLKRRKEQLRELKLKAIGLKKPKLKKELLAKLVHKVDLGEIENVEELQKEAEILHGIDVQ